MLSLAPRFPAQDRALPKVTLDEWKGNQARISALAALALLSTSLLGCTGIISGDRPSGSTGASADPAAVVPGSDGEPGVNAPQPELPRFKVPAQFPVLLPFDVRISRLSAVVGLPYSDPAFDTLRANATQLGDYDYANGLEPDNTWTAFKLSLWVQSLKPVCSSQAMLARYPGLPESLRPLVETAYGRALSEQDSADMNAALGALPLSPESRTQTTCLAVLSSLEFLAQ
jgi:hypothetical protein